MGAKRTADLIPLCHPIALTRVDIEFDTQAIPDAVPLPGHRRNRRSDRRRMEALTAVQTALATIYDVVPGAVDRGMCIEAVRLLEKQGGRSGHWQRSAD